MSPFARYKRAIHNDPIQRDLRTYTFMAGCSLVLIVSIALIGGLYLKQGAKHPTKHIVFPYSLTTGCYLWSDGHVQCERDVADKHYGCKGYGECP